MRRKGKQDLNRLLITISKKEKKGANALIVKVPIQFWKSIMTSKWKQVKMFCNVLAQVGLFYQKNENLQWLQIRLVSVIDDQSEVPSEYNSSWKYNSQLVFSMELKQFSRETILIHCASCSFSMFQFCIEVNSIVQPIMCKKVKESLFVQILFIAEVLLSVVVSTSTIKFQGFFPGTVLVGSLIW